MRRWQNWPYQVSPARFLVVENKFKKMVGAYVLCDRMNRSSNQLLPD
jgi:hypothetical protein